MEPMLDFIYARGRHVIQYQIPDYYAPPKRTSFRMNDPRHYAKAYKILRPVFPPRHPRRRGRKRGTHFHSLWEWLHPVTLPQTRVEYLLRFHKVTPPAPRIAEEVIGSRAAGVYQDIPAFDGFFDDLVRLSDFSYFDRAEVDLAAKGISLGAPSLRDMVVFELARLQTGNRSYEEFARNLLFFCPWCLSPLLRAPALVPTRQDFSRLFRALPEDVLEEYFFDRLEELRQLRVVVFRVLLWDTQFIHSNASDYKDKKTGAYSDPDAGLCVHDNKFLGVGFKASTLYAYCGDRVVPVFCRVFPGNTAEVDCFRQTVEAYFESGLPPPVVVIADSGGYSVDNLGYLARRGVVPLVNARANITNQPVKQFAKHLFLNTEYIPARWSDDDVRALYAVRTAIERCYSHVVVVFNAKRVSIRGLAGVTKHRWVVLILDVLKVLASYKVGRPDLFQRPTAFARTRLAFPAGITRSLYSAAGYELIGETEAGVKFGGRNRDKLGLPEANFK